MKESLRWHGVQILTALIAALAVVSLGVQANVAFADDPGGEDIDVPAPAPAPAPAPPPPPPPADEDNFHLYVSGNVAGGFTKGRSSGSIIGFGGPFPNTGSDRDEDVFGGGSLGLHYDASPVGVRVELEGQAARGLDLETNTGLFAATTLHTNINTWAMFTNIWLDFPITESISLFGGGGMGFAVHDMTTSPPGTPLGDKTRDDTVWAWQTGGGVSVAVTDWLAFDTSYRFVDLGEPDLRVRLAPFPSDLEMHVQSHDVMLGVRMNFFSF